MLSGFILLSAACSDDEEYTYPSVVTELVDAVSNAEKTIAYIRRDNGDLFYMKDQRIGASAADSTYRCLSMYEVLKDENGKATQYAKVYQLKCEVCLQQKDTVAGAKYLDKSLEGAALLKVSEDSSVVDGLVLKDASIDTLRSIMVTSETFSQDGLNWGVNGNIVNQIARELGLPNTYDVVKGIDTIIETARNYLVN